MSFFTELKRRNVFRVGVAYAIVAWLLIQIAATVLPTFDAPRWALQTITFIIILGFPLALFLAWAFELTPEGIKATSPVGPAQYHTRTTGQQLNVTIIGLMALVIVFLVINTYVLKKSPEDTREPETTPTVAATVAPAPAKVAEAEPVAPPNSIAVLPFTDMSPDKDQDYFVDGMAEEILNSLARIAELEVRGRTSSFYFKGKNEELLTISRMLNVEYVLEGSVRKAGNQVRITVQLINASKDEHLWSKTYDRALDDIFAIQEDIAKSVADTLQITLGVGELGRTPGMTRNVEAYEAFLAGRSLMRNPGRENVSRAIEQQEQAVALDPNFAVAWQALTNAYGNAIAFIPERAEEFIAKVDAAQTRVIELVPEADYALRIKAQRSGDRVVVERLWKQALAQDPANSDTNMGYGGFLNQVGRPKEAIEYFQRAVRVEPLAVPTHLGLGVAYELSGNSVAAGSSFKKGRDLSNDPTISNTLLLVLALEEKDRARIDEYRKQISTPDNNPNPGSRTLGQVTRALLDNPENADAELRQFLTDPAFANPFNRTAIAVWAAYFGDYKLALQIRQELNFIEFSIWRPILKPMRQLPGFKDLVTKSGLLDYWRKTGNWGDFCHPVGEDDFECE